MNEENIKYIPQDKLSETLNSPTVKLPYNDGTNFAKRCNSPEDLISFILKFDNLKCWEQSGVLEMMEEETDEELIYIDVEEEEWDVYLYNRYFPADKCNQLNYRLVNVYSDKSFHLNESLYDEQMYPMLVSYYALDTFDRCGDISYTNIHIIPLDKLEDGIFIV